MYTDPGSGIFLIQIVAVGVLTVVYRFRQTIAALFGSKRGENPDCKN